MSTGVEINPPAASGYCIATPILGVSQAGSSGSVEVEVGLGYDDSLKRGFTMAKWRGQHQNLGFNLNHLGKLQEFTNLNCWAIKGDDFPIKTNYSSEGEQ